MYDFRCQTVPIFSICILFTKIIETFWSRDVTDTWVLAHFVIKYFGTYKSLCAKLFEISEEKMSQKLDKSSLNYIKSLSVKLF